MSLTRHITTTLLSFLLATTILSATRAEDDANWEKVKETDDGVVIYMRKKAGTTVKEVLVNLIVNAPPRHVLDAACDPDSFKESVKYVEQNNYYWVGSKDVWYTYQMVNYPVVTRRDWALRFERKLDPDKGVYRLSWTTTKKKGPFPRENIIRVTLATGKIDVVPKDNGKKSLLKYYMRADPGGNIPGWVMNIANKASMPAIVREIRDAAMKRAINCAKGNCQLWDAVSH